MAMGGVVEMRQRRSSYARRQTEGCRCHPKLDGEPVARKIVGRRGRQKRIRMEEDECCCTSASTSRGTKERGGPSADGPTDQRRGKGAGRLRSIPRERDVSSYQELKGQEEKWGRGVDAGERSSWEEDGGGGGYRLGGLSARRQEYVNGASDRMEGLGWLQLLAQITGTEESEELSLWSWCALNLF